MRKRILLIDDDKDYSKSLGRNFIVYTCYGFRHIEDSREWREAMADFRPDLVVIDLNMPEVNGLEVASAIRSDNRFSNTKILLATAMRTRAENETQGGTYQGFDCVSKEGLDIDVLSKIIGELLAK